MPARLGERQDGVTEASRLFDELNRRYWRGRLPKYRVRFSRRVTRRQFCEGLCDHAAETIFLAPGLDPHELQELLLHEMVHVRTMDEPHDGHGPRFRRELKRLIARGEAALERHLDQLEALDFRGSLAELKRELRGELEAMAEDTKRPRPWPVVYRRLQEIVDWPGWRRAWGRSCPRISMIAWLQEEWRGIGLRKRGREREEVAR